MKHGKQEVIKLWTAGFSKLKPLVNLSQTNLDITLYNKWCDTGF